MQSSYIGDDDSNSFGTVKEELENKYVDKYRIEKKDCIGHVIKRMDSALLTFKNKCKGTILPNGETVGGGGRLTDKIIDRLETYDGCAVRKNKGNEEKIIKVIWALYYHMILGPSYESLIAQHAFCPDCNCRDGKDSCCKFKKDLFFDTSTYDPSKCLPFVFQEELKPIFEQLSSSNVSRPEVGGM